MLLWRYFCQRWSDFTSFSSVSTIGFEQDYVDWEVNSDPKNLCSLILSEKIAEQRCTDYFHEVKKLQI